MNKVMLSVGTQFSFDRLLCAVDKWASGKTNLDFFVQAGESTYTPENFVARTFIDHDEFSKEFYQADFIVSHAGMGNIIRALELGKPIVIMPRLSSLGEHRNDHQLGTARKFSEKNGIYLAESEQQLGVVLDAVLLYVKKGTAENHSNLNCNDLVEFLNECIEN